jgi:hypothetical protein
MRRRIVTAGVGLDLGKANRDVAVNDNRPQQVARDVEDGPVVERPSQDRTELVQLPGDE